MIRVFLGFCMAVLLAAMPVAAQNFPPLTGRVVDQANLLRPEQKVDLDSKLSALEAQSGRQFVVATVNSLEGREIDEYAYLLGRHWKIGDERSDDGAVMVVAPKERKVFIATGYGAGGYLTDSVTGRIIREAVLPRFKQNPPDYGGGIIAGADRVIEIMKLPPEEAARQAQQTAAQDRKRGQSSVGFLPVIFIVVIFFMIINGIRRAAGSGRKYRGRRGGGIDPMVVLWGLQALSSASRGGSGGWGGGGFGGGFGGGGGFSGGGGSFGGGGAGGSW